MFELMPMAEAKSARRPYSMAISPLIQIVALGMFCLMPFLFKQVLPTMQLASVLAAPRPPVVLNGWRRVDRVKGGNPRLFQLSRLPLQIKQFQAATAMRGPDAPPSVDLGADQNDVPFGIPGAAPESLPPAMPVASSKPQRQAPIRVGSILGASLIRMVRPQDPPLARASRIQGIVEFTAMIGKEGTVENLVLLRGHPLLVNAAKDAVVQWRYKPTILNGVPVEVITDIIVNFSLSQ